MFCVIVAYLKYRWLVLLSSLLGSVPATLTRSDRRGLDLVKEKDCAEVWSLNTDLPVKHLSLSGNRE